MKNLLFINKNQIDPEETDIIYKRQDDPFLQTRDNQIFRRGVGSKKMFGVVTCQVCIICFYIKLGFKFDEQQCHRDRKGLLSLFRFVSLSTLV